MNWSNKTLLFSKSRAGFSKAVADRGANHPCLKISKVVRLIILGLCVPAILTGFTAPAHAKQKKDSKKSAQGAKSGKQIDIPIPVGHDAKGIRIPTYDAKGKIQMFFNIDTAFRVDDGHLRMANLKIETYDDNGKSDMLIDMPASLLDLGTNIISSVDPITIHRSDFEITGGNMTFNTQTRYGKFSGPVRMLIFNHDDIEQEPSPTPEGTAQ